MASGFWWGGAIRGNCEKSGLVGRRKLGGWGRAARGGGPAKSRYAVWCDFGRVRTVLQKRVKKDYHNEGGRGGGRKGGKKMRLFGGAGCRIVVGARRLPGKGGEYGKKKEENCFQKGGSEEKRAV